MKLPKLFHRIPLTPEEKKTRRFQRLMGILSGVLMGLAFPPVPFPAPLLLFFGLIPYFTVLDKKEKLIDINRFTYLTFFVFNLLTIYWVGSWSSEADPFLMIGGFLLLFVNTSFFLIPSTLYYLAKRVVRREVAFLLFPFFWVAYEYFYMITDASFPWLTLGNGLTYFHWFIQIADTIGALGLSLVVVYINVFTFFAIRYYRTKRTISILAASVSLLLLLGPVIYGIHVYSSYSPAGKEVSVGLIQPNVDPWDKWSEGGDLWNFTKQYIDLSKQAIDKGAQIIFWPETSLPVYLRDGSHRDVIDSLHAFTDRYNVFLVTGMPDFNTYRDKSMAPKDAKYSQVSGLYFTTYNSVFLFTPHERYISRYAKMKLVPFGERVPFVDQLPFLGDFIKWNVGLSGWNVGRDTVVFNLTQAGAKDTIKLNSLVCFESVYPAFVSSFSRRGSELISVVTNDSWYGNSSGPYQHKEIGVLRAVENRKYVVRAANGGISTIIDPLGRTLASSKMYEKTFIEGKVRLERKLTFFAKYPRVIPNISFSISLFVVIMFALWKIFMPNKKKSA